MPIGKIKGIGLCRKFTRSLLPYFPVHQAIFTTERLSSSKTFVFVCFPALISGWIRTRAGRRSQASSDLRSGSVERSPSICSYLRSMNSIR